MTILWLILATFLASIIGTFTGFGVSTMLIPVFLLFYSAPETLLAVGIIHWFGNIWKLLLFRKGIDYKLILYFGATGIILSFVGARLSLTLSQDILSRGIGILLISYVLFIYLKPNFQISKNKRNALLGGSLYGFSSGISGIGGEIRSMFLTAFNLEKAVYLATTGAISLTIDTTRIITYAAGGTQLERTLALSLVPLIILSLIGAYIGKKFVEKVPKKEFRLIIVVFLFFIALKLLVFP